MPARTRCRSVILETRIKHYPRRNDVHEVWRDGKRVGFLDDPGGVGVETARSARACPDCADATR